MIHVSIDARKLRKLKHPSRYHISYNAPHLSVKRIRWSLPEYRKSYQSPSRTNPRRPRREQWRDLVLPADSHIHLLKSNDEKNVLWVFWRWLDSLLIISYRNPGRTWDWPLSVGSPLEACILDTPQMLLKWAKLTGMLYIYQREMGISQYSFYRNLTVDYFSVWHRLLLRRIFSTARTVTWRLWPEISKRRSELSWILRRKKLANCLLLLQRSLLLSTRASLYSEPGKDGKPSSSSLSSNEQKRYSTARRSWLWTYSSSACSPVTKSVTYYSKTDRRRTDNNSNTIGSSVANNQVGLFTLKVADDLLRGRYLNWLEHLTIPVRYM